jgi:carboxyvinyl-carboxyphosphonate phosphorylmutase
VDADHGYGNALNAGRTVSELEREGAAALTLEDTSLPLPYDAQTAPKLISTAEAVGKIEAALEARVDPAMIIIARTGGAGLSDMADVTARLKAYAATGADMVFVRGVETRRQIDQIQAATDLPIALSLSNPDLRNLDELSQTNVRIVLAGQRPIKAAYKAVARAIVADRGGVAHDDVMTPAEMQKLTRDDILTSRIQRFMTPTAGTE